MRKVLQRFKRCVHVDRDHHRRSVNLMKNGTDFKEVGPTIFPSEEHRHEVELETPTVSSCSKRQFMNKQLL